jgi:hypothetical protein
MNATAFRLARQHLSARVGRDETIGVARRICGLHAQVLSSADLALWTRVRGHRPGVLAKLLWEDRALVKTWLMRGTLHLVPADDLPLYVGALDHHGEYQKAWLKFFKVTARQMEELVEAIGEALGDGPLTREELIGSVRGDVGASLAGRLRSGWGSFLKPRRGLLCHGPSRGQNVTFARPDVWLGRWSAPPERTAARAELFRRFLTAYGPASGRDFQMWMGSSRRMKEELGALAGELEEVAPKTFVLARDRADLESARLRGGVRLLPGFDHYVMHPNSERPVPAEMRDRVYRQAGWVSPTVLERGRVVGVWEPRKRGNHATVEVRPFEPLSTATRAAVAKEARALETYLSR